MSDNLNRIKNADFLAGKSEPAHWKWVTRRADARWQRPNGFSGQPRAGITIHAAHGDGFAWFSQTVSCKPQEYYRLEALVSCRLAPGNHQGGFVLQVRPLTLQDKDASDTKTTLPITRATQPMIVRAYYEAPPQARRLEVRVGIRAAEGSAVVHLVRCVEIVEPDEESHPLSIPPPSFALSPPRTVQSIRVCTARPERRVVGLLKDYFGAARVRVANPKELDPAAVPEDALLLPDEVLPGWVGTLKQLERLAHNRVLIISLPAFAKLAGERLKLRRIEQPDDPIHAKVAYADYFTRGFALADVFPYAWTGRRAGSFAQNQFRKTSELERFCERHGFVPALSSMCCYDRTSDQPICLYKPTPGGALFVLDVEPAEEPLTTAGETVVAVHLLLSVLAQELTGLGQYVLPVAKEPVFRDLIREAGYRFGSFNVIEDDAPSEQIREQLVTIGGDDQGFGLPLKPKPVILVRSGLFSGDMESIYGALLWFKQLLRMPPYTCPYAQTLASRFRLAWIPCAAPWEAPDRFDRKYLPPLRETVMEVGDGGVAAWIDVVSRPVNQARLVIPSFDRRYSRHIRWLPQLAFAFPAGNYYSAAVPPGSELGDRDAYAWRRCPLPGVEVVVDESAFLDQVHREVLGAGGLAMRMEVPGSSADFPAYSIMRTDLAATLLEQVIGLCNGMIAVNRASRPVHFDALPPVAPGEALILDADDPALSVTDVQAG